MNAFQHRMIVLGQCLVSPAPGILTTILGSSVAVCLWDKALKIGGMNHYILPEAGGKTAKPGTRGVTAIQLLIDQMCSYACTIENMEAKVFGGATSLYLGSNFLNVGEENTTVALQILAQYKIPVTASHVGGSISRNIAFDTATGDVSLQVIMDPEMLERMSACRTMRF